MKNSSDEILKFLKDHHLNEEWEPTLNQIMLEIRGSGAEASLAELNLSLKIPYLDSAGNVFSGSSAKLAPYYHFEVNMALNNFRSNYQSRLFEFTSGLSHALQLAFAKLLSKYDFTSEPKNPLTFSNVMGIHRR